MSEAKALKRKQLIDRASGRTDEPTVSNDSDISYNSQLMTALNWHARESDGKQRKAWVLSYLKKAKRPEEATLLTDVDDWHFYSVGAIVRLKMIGADLSERHEAFIETRITELLAAPVKSKPLVAAKPTNVVNIQDRVLEKAREFCGEIDGKVDEFIMAGCPTGFKIGMASANGPTAKYVASVYKKTLAELEEVLEGKDKQLVEGYSHLTKVQLKRFIALCQSVIDGCEQAKKMVVRKPRTRKAKPAGEIVKRLKYMKQDEEFGLKSVLPSSIVGSTELWVYNTKTRKLQAYRAVAGELLTVKGTSILNYDTANSGSRTLRKPEQVVAYATLGKRALNTQYKALTTKEQAVNGRINEDCILLKVF